MKKLVRITLVLLLITCATALLAVCGAYMLLHSSWGQRQLAQFAKEELNITIEGISGSLPFAPRIESLTLHAENGDALLVVENLEAQWGVKLFPLSWHVSSLSAQHIQLHRMPPDTEGKQADAAFAFPALPRLTIEKISLARILLDEEVEGQERLFSAEGSLRTFAQAEDTAAEFTLRTLKGPTTTLNISTHGISTMAVTAELTEEPGGLIGTAAGFSEKPLRAYVALKLNSREHLLIEQASLAAGGHSFTAEGGIATPFTSPAFHVRAETNYPLPDSLSQLAERPLRISATGSWHDASIVLDTLDVDATHAQIRGKDLRLEGMHLTGQAQILIDDVQRLHPQAHGVLAVNLRTDGSLLEPALQVDATLKDEPRVVRLQASAILKEKLLRLSKMKLSTEGVLVAGVLDYDLESGLADGTLKVDAKTLEGLAPFTNVSLRGRGTATLTLTHEHDRQGLQADGALRDLAVADTSVSTLAFVLRSADIAALEAINVRAKASGIASEGVIVDTAALEASGTRKRTDFHLSTESAHASGLSLDAKGRLQTSLPDWTLHLNSLAGTQSGRAFALLSPASLSQRGAVLALPSARLRFLDADVQAQGKLEGTRVDATFSVSQLALAALDAADHGTLSGTGNLGGTLSDPVLRTQWTVEGLAMSDKRPAGFTLTANASLEKSLLSASVEPQGIDGSAVAEVELPVVFSLSPFKAIIADHGTLHGAVRTDTQISAISALFLPSDQTLRGQLRGGFVIGGTLSDPAWGGSLALTQGRYENLSTGTLLEQLTLLVAADKNRLVIRNARAQAGAGKVELSGQAALQEPFSANISAQLTDAELINMPQASGIVNGALDVTGDVRALKLAGTLALGPMELRLPDGGGSETEQVDIVNPQALPAQSWQKNTPASPARGPEALALAVKIEAPSRVFVRGRGLETEMRGGIDIAGTAADPQITGAFTTIRGTFTLLDRQLDIAEGTLNFRGSIPPSPYLLMVAETETSEMTAGIRIEGPIRSPELMLTSTPTRPEDEIMAHLLFGRELKSITPYQGVQLAQAIQTLRGAGGGRFDFLGTARNLLGVDRLNVSESETGDIGVGAGKYISDKIYIGVEGGADPQAGKVKAEIEISPRFSVETETGGRESGARLNWKRDY